MILHWAGRWWGRVAGAITLEVVIILLLVLINGGLSLAELAIVSSRRTRLQQRADAGSSSARAALALAEAPTSFLSTVQVGITLVAILTGAFGGATLVDLLSDRLTDTGLSERWADAAAVTVVVLVITYLSVVVGELVPKRIALHMPERVAVAVAPPMRILTTIAKPAVIVLSRSTDLLLRPFGVRAQADQAATEEDIQLVIREGAESGVFLPAEHDMVSRVFRLADRRVYELMTPRTEIAWVEIDDPPQDIWQEMSLSRHLRFPVCRGDLDHIAGVISVKDVWQRMVRGEPLDIASLMQAPLFVPESMPALTVLERFRAAGAELAIVIDEYGGASGLVTLHDILEALVGDLPDDSGELEQRIVRREDGTLLVDAMLPVDDLKDVLGVDELPDEDNYQTLAGFVLLNFAHIPTAGEHFEWNGRRFEVMDMDGKRVDKVLIGSAAAE